MAIKRNSVAPGARSLKSNAAKKSAVWPTTGGSRSTTVPRKPIGSKPGYTTPGFKPGSRTVKK